MCSAVITSLVGRLELEKHHKGWTVNVRVRLVTTPLMVHQIQSGRQTHGYHGRPSVNPSIDFLHLRLVVLILPKVSTELCLEYASGFVTRLPV